MKDFTYTYNNSELSLDHDAFHWLDDMGLKETQWILDTIWLSRNPDLAFKQWID